MNQSITMYVGMDAQKNEHKVCILASNEPEMREGTVRNNEREITRFIQRLQKQAVGEIRVCYEAGPCGFDLQQTLQKAGVICEITAPPLIPVKPGGRVKTDRRDARKLAKYYKQGLLTTVVPPKNSVRTAIIEFTHHGIFCSSR